MSFYDRGVSAVFMSAVFMSAVFVSAVFMSAVFVPPDDLRMFKHIVVNRIQLTILELWSCRSGLPSPLRSPLTKNPFPSFGAHYTEFNPPITHGDIGLALSPPLTLPSRQRDVPHGYVWSASDLATSNSSSTVSQNHLVHCSVSRPALVFRLNFGNPFHSVTTGCQQHVTNSAIQPGYILCVVTVPGRQEPSFEQSNQFITNRRVLFSFFWRDSPQWARASSFTRF
jgi:hypothetical protein